MDILFIKLPSLPFSKAFLKSGKKNDSEKGICQTLLLCLQWLDLLLKNIVKMNVHMLVNKIPFGDLPTQLPCIIINMIFVCYEIGKKVKDI